MDNHNAARKYIDLTLPCDSDVTPVLLERDSFRQRVKKQFSVPNELRTVSNDHSMSHSTRNASWEILTDAAQPERKSDRPSRASRLQKQMSLPALAHSLASTIKLPVDGRLLTPFPRNRTASTQNLQRRSSIDEEQFNEFQINVATVVKNDVEFRKLKAEMRASKMLTGQGAISVVNECIRSCPPDAANLEGSSAA